MSKQELKTQMRMLAIQAHAHQQRNAGRVPYVVHVMSVAEVLADAVSQSGDPIDDDTKVDLYLAALGHDLYEDTSVTREEINARFGPRVDAMIDAMTNRVGDHDRAEYEARIQASAEEVRLLKLADLVDNVTSCAYGIHDLGIEWIQNTFLPIATGMKKTVERATFVRYSRTAAILLSWLDFAMKRLKANLEIFKALGGTTSEEANARLAAWDGTFPDDKGETLAQHQEREVREGWLVKGMRVFHDKDW